jgi:hypothetical protein
MQIEIMKALVSMVQQGGWFTMGGMALWGIFQIIKICLVVYLVKAIATMIYNYNNNYLATKQTLNKEKIVLLSQEVSTRLTNTLEEFSSTMIQSVQKLESQLNDLKK